MYIGALADGNHELSNLKSRHEKHYPLHLREGNTLPLLRIFYAHVIKILLSFSYCTFPSSTRASQLFTPRARRIPQEHQCSANLMRFTLLHPLARLVRKRIRAAEIEANSSASMHRRLLSTYLSNIFTFGLWLNCMER